MAQSASIAFVIGLALLAANLPFATRRVLAVWLPRQPKGIATELLEWLVLYLAVGAVALLLERRAGQIAPQAWQFYAVTACVFAVLAFPGFVWRHLVRRGRR